MKIRKIAAACLSILMMAGCMMSVNAAEDASTFDYRAYANIYPDLKAAYGYDADKLYAHYVNYGQAEGRVGSFLAAPNPKNAPIYGVSTGFTNQTLPPELFGQAIVPATLLDPIPPTKPSQMNDWRLNQLTTAESMSNAKLVAECISVCGYMDLARAAWKNKDANDPAHAWNIEPTEMWEDKLYREFNDRLDAVRGASDPNSRWYESSIKSAAYQRAIMSDTRILEQHANQYKDLPAPPADPFVPPAAQ